MTDFSSLVDAMIALLGGVAILITAMAGLSALDGPTTPAVSIPPWRVDEDKALPKAA
jgi:hypothetical protein